MQNPQTKSELELLKSQESFKKKKSYSVTDGKVHKYRIDFIVNKKLKNAQLRLNDT